MKRGMLGARRIDKAAFFSAATTAAAILIAVACGAPLPAAKDAPPLPLPSDAGAVGPHSSHASENALLAVIEAHPSRIVFDSDGIGGEVRVSALGIRMFDGTWSSLSDEDVIVFSSSNADVASVSADGAVAAVGPGIADVILERGARVRGVVPVIVRAPAADAPPPFVPDDFARRGKQAPISETALFTAGRSKERDGL